MSQDNGQNDSAAGGAAAAQPVEDQSKQGETLTFEGWIEKQDEGVRSLLDSHTNGLKSALNTERENRKAFEKQIKELAGSAQKEGEFKNQLTELSAQLELSERRAAFAETALKEGVSNPKALFTLAIAGDFFDKKGNAKFEDLKKEYPEFFVKAIPKGNAGEGSNPAPVQSMNDAIRRMAGKTNL